MSLFFRSSMERDCRTDPLSRMAAPAPAIEPLIGKLDRQQWSKTMDLP
jgi:hypothetical protein